MDYADHPQRMQRPVRRYLILGYVGSLLVLIVDIVVFAFYDFFWAHMFWEPYYLLSAVGTWAVFFPISVLVAMGYWGLRIKYDQSYLAVSALATAGYLPALWLVSFGLAILPSWYQTGEFYFISFNGVLLAAGMLVIVGLLLMRKRCVKPEALIALVVLRLMAILLITIQFFLLYIVEYTPWAMMILVMLVLVRDGIGVVSNIPLVLFFGSEHRAVATQ